MQRRSRLAQVSLFDVGANPRSTQRVDQIRRYSLDSSIMSLQDVLDDSIRTAEEISLTRVRSLHLLLERHWLMGSVLLSETRDVPNSDCQIHRGRNDEIFLGMELSTPGGLTERGMKVQLAGSRLRPSLDVKLHAHDVVVVSAIKRRVNG